MARPAIRLRKFVPVPERSPRKRIEWNYSRSLLFANGPYYHFGLRTTVPIGNHFTGGFQLVNGWNNVEDNNSPKTAGVTAAFTSGKFSISEVYYVGNEKQNTVIDEAIASPIKIRAPAPATSLIR
jgi:hypothetical protein